MNSENDENGQSTSAPEPERKEPAMEPAQTEKPEIELAMPQQPEGESYENVQSGKRIPELVKAESLAEGELPEPSEHVIREHVPAHVPQPTRAPDGGKESGQNVRQAEGLEQTEKGLKDNSGRYFDPAKHQHRNGIPKTSEKGYFRPWGRIHKKAGLHLKPEGFAGHEAEEREKDESFIDKAKRAIFGDRKPDPEPEPAKTPESREPGPETGPQRESYPNGGLIGLPQPSESGKKNSEAATAAAQLVAMEEMIAVMVFSEEWQFISEERKGLVMAWTRAFEEKGIVETPWWMELGAAHAVIIANRADKPKTREKLGKMKAKFMKKIIDLRTAKAPAQGDQREEGR